MTKANIDMLVADLKPVQTLKLSGAYFLSTVLIAGICLLIVATIGIRADISAMTPGTILLFRSGVLLLLGSATLQALALSARPGVDSQNDGWKWTLAVAALFPLATVMSWLLARPSLYYAATASSGIWCLAISLAAALVVGTALVLWLRRGAPVRINRSAWLIGLAAGSFGTFCYNIYCPSRSVEYAGIWYTLAVAASAVAARLVAPRFIRW